jgi:hypothetical protein
MCPTTQSSHSQTKSLVQIVWYTIELELDTILDLTSIQTRENHTSNKFLILSIKIKKFIKNIQELGLLTYRYKSKVGNSFLNIPHDLITSPSQKSSRARTHSTCIKKYVKMWFAIMAV